MKKRFLSLLMCFCMIVSLLPTSVLAISDDADEEVGEDETGIVTQADGTITMQYDDYLSVAAYGNDAAVTDGTDLLEVVDGYLHAKGVGEAAFTADGKTYSVTVEKAKLNIVLVAGQSNANGVHGRLDNVAAITPAKGNSYWWYEDANGSKLTDLSEKVTEQETKEPSKSVGWYPALAAEWYARTGEKTVIIHKCVPGTPISTWASYDGNSVTGTTTGTADAVKACISAIKGNENYEIAHAGYYWLQGETDAFLTNSEGIKAYTTAERYETAYLAMHKAFTDALDTAGVGSYGAILSCRTRYNIGSYQALEYCGMRVAQQDLANQNADIYMATVLTDDWHEAGTVSFTAKSGKFDTLTYTKADMGANNIHYNQSGYNVLGMDATDNMYDALVEEPAVTDIELIGHDGYTKYQDDATINVEDNMRIIGTNNAEEDADKAQIVARTLPVSAACSKVTMTLTDKAGNEVSGVMDSRGWIDTTKLTEDLTLTVKAGSVEKIYTLSKTSGGTDPDPEPAASFYYNWDFTADDQYGKDADGKVTLNSKADENQLTYTANSASHSEAGLVNNGYFTMQTPVTLSDTEKWTIAWRGAIRENTNAILLSDNSSDYSNGGRTTPYLYLRNGGDWVDSAHTARHYDVGFCYQGVVMSSGNKRFPLQETVLSTAAWTLTCNGDKTLTLTNDEGYSETVTIDGPVTYNGVLGRFGSGLSLLYQGTIEYLKIYSADRAGEVEDYYWDFTKAADGKLESETTDNWSENTLTFNGTMGTVTADGLKNSSSNGYFTMENAAFLPKDEPWTIEWQGTTTNQSVLLANNNDATDVTSPYKAGEYIYIFNDYSKDNPDNNGISLRTNNITAAATFQGIPTAIRQSSDTVWYLIHDGAGNLKMAAEVDGNTYVAEVPNAIKQDYTFNGVLGYFVKGATFCYTGAINYLKIYHTAKEINAVDAELTVDPSNVRLTGYEAGDKLDTTGLVVKYGDTVLTNYGVICTTGALKAGRNNVSLRVQYMGQTKYVNLVVDVDFTVNFESDGTVQSTQKVAVGGKATEPKDIVKEDCHLLGWYNGETLYDFSAEVTEDLTLTAKWAPNTYYVKFDANTANYTGSMARQEFTYGEAQELNENQFVRTDKKNDVSLYVFDGWNTEADGTGTAYADGAEAVNLTVWDEDEVTLYAQWKHVTNKLTYVSAQGTAPDAADVDIFSEVTVAGAPADYDTTKYIFKGWHCDYVGIARDPLMPSDKFDMPNTDITLTAQFEEIIPAAKANLTYADTVSDGAADAVEIEVGAWITVKAAPAAVEGKSFSGWKSNINGIVYQPGDKFQMPSTDVTLTAVWEDPAEICTVTFDNDGAEQTVQDLTVVSGSYMTLPANLTKEGYTFKGWSDGEKIYAAGSSYQVTGNVAFTAVFTQNSTPKTFAVTFETGEADQTVPALTGVAAGTYITLPALTQNGYTFVGWTVESAADEAPVYAAGSTYQVTDDVTFIAVFEEIATPELLLVTFNSNDADQTVQPMEVAAGTSITLPAGLTKANSIFKGWKCGDELYAAGSTYVVKETTEFTAEFETAETYKVTFNNNGAEQTVANMSNVAAGSYITLPANLTKAGYTFKGWSDGKTLYAAGSSYQVTGDVTFTAEFEKDPDPVTYTVTYNTDGGSEAPVDTNSYAAGAYVTTASAPTKDGFTFAGWKSNVGSNAVYDAGAQFEMPAANVTLTAQWRVAVTGNIYIPAGNLDHGVHEEAYNAQLTAKKDNATGDPVAAGDVQFVLIGADGKADTSRSIGHGLTLNADGSITGTANGAGEVTFKVRLANAAGDFVSDTFAFTIVIDKASRACTVTMEDWTYGEAAKKPVVTLSKTEDPESITYLYKVKDAEDSNYTETVPTNAGEYTVKVVVAESANYLSCEGTADFKILKALITSVALDVTAPAAGEAAQSTIADGTGYTGTITWNPADATFAYNTVYTAAVILTPDGNHKFDSNTAADGWTVTLNEDGTLTLSQTFPKTAQDTVKTPVISPNGGHFYGSQDVTITCATDGADIYYTTDGTTPTTGSTKYTGAFEITSDTTVKAIAVKADYNDSAVAAAEFTKRTSSSSGGSSSTKYTVTVGDAKNGDVTSSHKTASSGTTVTITVDPDKGYELDDLTVTIDKTGKSVKVTDKGNGKYTFSMPSYAVSVEVSFVKETSFSDVPSGAYYEDAVNWAVKNGIASPAATFNPNGVCTRAQAVTFLWRAAGSPAPKSTVMPFTDVPAGSYYYDAVLWAVENGITKGTTNTTFSPDMKCSRGQIVTFLWRSQKSPAAGSVNPFTDVPTNAYYTDAVLWAVEESITGGTSATTFSPSNDCTRAQIITFIYRCMK